MEKNTFELLKWDLISPGRTRRVQRDGGRGPMSMAVPLTLVKRHRNEKTWKQSMLFPPVLPTHTRKTTCNGPCEVAGARGALVQPCLPTWPRWRNDPLSGSWRMCQNFVRVTRKM